MANFVVVILIALAVAFAIYRMVKKGHCGGCSSCSSGCSCGCCSGKRKK